MVVLIVSTLMIVLVVAVVAIFILIYRGHTANKTGAPRDASVSQPVIMQVKARMIIILHFQDCILVFNTAFGRN